jgi:hypothetical protein
MGYFETTAKWLGGSSWHPGSPRERRTARNAGGNGGDGPNRIYGCDWSDRYGAIEPARDRATCSDCGGSCRRDALVSGRPMSISNVPLERRSDGIDDVRINSRHQVAIVCSGCGASVECPSRCDWKAGRRRSHDASGLRTLRGEQLTECCRSLAACHCPDRRAQRFTPWLGRVHNLRSVYQPGHQAQSGEHLEGGGSPLRRGFVASDFRLVRTVAG